MTESLNKEREYLQTALLGLDEGYISHPSMSMCVSMDEYVAQRDEYYRDLVQRQGLVIQAMANMLLKLGENV